MWGFKRSPDNSKSTQIAFLYEALLGRKVDDQGMADWLRLWEGQPDWHVSQIANLIMTSPEFRRFHPVRPDSGPTYKAYPYFSSKLAFRPDDWMLQEIVQGGLYERYVLEAFLEAITPASRVLDLGANIGTFTIAAAEKAKHIVAVEMSPENAKILAINVHLNNLSNVTVLPCGVAETLRAITFESVKSSAYIANNTITLDNHILIDQALGVPLDTILELSTPDIIKIDIEGYEYKAIAPSKLIWKQKPIVFIEFCPVLLQRFSGVQPEKLAELFFSHGYSATILHRDMTRETVGRNLELLMTRAHEYVSRGITHLDIMMTPD
jgi:FkbM family methyltransferase